MELISGPAGSVKRTISAAGVCLAILLCLAGPARAADDSGLQPGKVEIKAVRIKGNTVLPAWELEQFRKKLVGQKLSYANLLEEVKSLSESLQEKYTSRGYVTTRVVVPSQTLEDGTIVMKVVEGKVGEVRVVGNKYFSTKHNYRPYLPEEGDIFNVRDLETSLNTVNKHPDKQANVVLEKGRKRGTTEVIARAKDNRPWHFSVELNNNGTYETEFLRSIFTAQYDNLFDRSQTAVVQYSTSPEDFSRVQQFAGAYYVPLGPLHVQDNLFWDASDYARRAITNSELMVYGGYSESDTGDIVQILELEGEGTLAGMKYSFPLPRFWSLSHTLALGMEWQNVKNIIQFGQANLGQDINKFPLYLRWSGTRKDSSGQTNLSAGVRWQQDSFIGHFDEDAYDSARNGVKPSYTSYNLGMQRKQKLPLGWTGVVDGGFQFSEDRLPPSEQYSFGGYDDVRGYRNRVIISDQSFVLRAEARTPTLDKKFFPASWDEQIQFLGFTDYGYASNNDAGSAELDNDSLLGVGVGMRASMFDSALQARLDTGVGMMDIDATQRDEAGNVIFHFGIEYTY